MELDLFDAIRLHLIVEVDVGDSRLRIEPYEVKPSDGTLSAFAIAGPTLGWVELDDWENLKITREHFKPREPLSDR